MGTGSRWGAFRACAGLLGDVPPCFPGRYVTNMASADTKFSGNLTLGDNPFQRTNLDNIRFFDFRAMDLFPKLLSAVRPLVKIIFFLGSPSQVLGVAARGVSAVMGGLVFRGGGCSIRQNANVAVRADDVAVNFYPTVSLPHFGERPFYAPAGFGCHAPLYEPSCVKVIGFRWSNHLFAKFHSLVMHGAKRFCGMYIAAAFNRAYAGISHGAVLSRGG